MLKRVRIPYLPLLVLALTDLVYAEEFRTVTPGAEYQAGPIHRMVFGDHCRDLWAQPLRVRVLDLKTVAGGLIVLRRGGGKQTRGLRFKSADGKVYKFRSINKDPSKALPEELREALLKDPN